MATKQATVRIDAVSSVILITPYARAGIFARSGMATVATRRAPTTAAIAVSSSLSVRGDRIDPMAQRLPGRMLLARLKRRGAAGEFTLEEAIMWTGATDPAVAKTWISKTHTRLVVDGGSIVQTAGGDVPRYRYTLP